MRDISPEDRQAVVTIGLALIFLAFALFLVTHVLKFRFVVGVVD